jgi:UDPglucose 6-dehydrogenase
MEKIGVIGRGILGEAVLQGMCHAFHVCWHDPYKKEWKQHNETRCHKLADLLELVDGPIFLCLPTPMLTTGAADISIVEDVVKQIHDIEWNKIGDDKVLIIKSTVPPGTTEILNKNYHAAVQCVFNPEFLREATSIEDFKNQDRIIIGGPHKAVSVVKQMYQMAYPEVSTTKTSSTIAEMVKYVTNCFLATKVAFANEISQICEKLDIDYDKVIEYATKDKRLGVSHWAVPGPDGHAGYGGKCFCKDLNALISVAHQLKVWSTVMEAAWDKNLEVRPERDWEVIPGVISKGEI